MPFLELIKNKKLSQPKSVVDEIDVVLPDNKKTKIYVARYLRVQVHPKLVVFDKSIPLLKWCKAHEISGAINGGFSLHHKDNLLGEIWTSGNKHQSVEFTKPWNDHRGSVHINHRGKIQIAPRQYLPTIPKGDLLQAGPLLVNKGRSLIQSDIDPEGISSSSDQFDDDWTGDSRFPRAAIGANDDFLICVTVDGYSPTAHLGIDTGLSLGELAEVMIILGATEALNLDGGSSTTLIANGKLINKPRGGFKDKYIKYKEGREISSAIIFEPLSLAEKFSLI
jgi:hypothetical protein